MAEISSSSKNRAFLYGDALFETILVVNRKPIYFKEHYFRLLAGMKQLKMEIPEIFNWTDFNNSVINFIEKSSIENLGRLRITVFRNSEGFYFPLQNEIGFTIDVKRTQNTVFDQYTLGVYEENLLNNNGIDNIKTTNRLINVLANLYAQQNNFDNVVLLNHKKNVVSVSNANLFLVKNEEILTPALSEGCIAGIIRQKVIDVFANNLGYKVTETSILMNQLLEADEIFITNSIMGIQAISVCSGTSYKNDVSNKIIELYQDAINSITGFQEN